MLYTMRPDEAMQMCSYVADISASLRDCGCSKKCLYTFATLDISHLLGSFYSDLLLERHLSASESMLSGVRRLNMQVFCNLCHAL